MAQEKKYPYSGNKFSLRGKPTDILKRISAISDHMGALGDILVSTWGSIIISLLVLIVGLFAIVFVVFQYKAIILKNIPAIILMFIGTICIALQFLLIDPSEGSQIMVSVRFLQRKFKQLTESKAFVKLRPFRFVSEIETKDVIQKPVRGRLEYIAGYSVTGVVSPTSFEDDLEYYVQREAGVLANLERDTTLTTTVSISKVKPKKLDVPSNASQGMLIERQQRYQRIAKNVNNKKIVTNMFLTAPTLETLQKRRQNLEAQLAGGLVVGYSRLANRDFKKALKDIYE